MNPKRKSTAKTVSELSRDTGISRQTLTAWRADGCDIQDPSQLSARIKSMRDSGKNPPLQDAKLRKVQLECERLQLTIDREKSELIPLAAVLEEVAAIAAIVRSAILKFENDLPPSLEGLSAEKMAKIIREKSNEILSEIHYSESH